MDNKSASAQGYLFSAEKDFILFFGPIVLVFLLIIILKVLGLSHSQLGSNILYLYSILFNLPHVFSTSLKTYFDSQERKRLSSLLVIAPLLSFFCVWYLQEFSPQGLLYLAAYMAMFHHIRQQYGLIMISAKKSCAKSADLFCDRLLIYSLTIFCLIRLHTLSDAPFWFDPGDMIPLNKNWSSWAHGFFLIILFSYYFRVMRNKRWIKGKQIVIISTLITWYLSVMIRSFPMVILLLGINHNLTYLFFVFHYEYKKNRNSQGLGNYLYSKFGLMFIYSILVVVSVAHEWAWGVEEKITANQSVFVALLYVPQLTHYILDAFIWRRGHYQSQENKTTSAGEMPLNEWLNAKA